MCSRVYTNHSGCFWRWPDKPRTQQLIQVFQALYFWPPKSIHRVISCKCMARRKCKCSLFSKYASTSVRRCMVGKVTWLHDREASWVVIWERRMDLTKANVLDTSNIRLNILYLKRRGSALWCSVGYEQSLFFLGPSSKPLGTRKWPRAWRRRETGEARLFSSRAAALVSCEARACTPLTKSEEKERLLAV